MSKYRQPVRIKSFENLNHAIGEVQRFNVELLDEHGFKRYPNSQRELGAIFERYDEICFTGYFGEDFYQLIKNVWNKEKPKIRIISPRIMGNDRRSRENVKTLKKLLNLGAEIKIHERVHCRIFLCYHVERKNGFLILGSFDFNDDCMSRRRRDLGLMTVHPDVTNQVYEYFNRLWNEEEEAKPFTG